MTGSIPPYILFLASIVISAVISAYVVKKIIFIATQKNLFDIPDNIRKIHGAQIPSLGGIGIFVGFLIMFGLFAFLYGAELGKLTYIIISSAILFFTGVYDDIMNMRPVKKLLAQLLASGISIYLIVNSAEGLVLSGLFASVHLQGWLLVVFLTIFCTFFINAFNFIDGIDGLAGSLAVLYTVIPGCLFAGIHSMGTAGILFSLTGATLGLLFYNRPPARIYMGDTGSMFLGLLIFVFSIKLIGAVGIDTQPDAIRIIHDPHSASIVLLAMLFLPMFDAIRVFLLRASKGRSPLTADRSHLHYYLLDAGFTHTRSVLVIVGTNILLIIAGYLLQDVNPLLAVLCLVLISSAMMSGVYRLRQNKLAGRK